MGLLNLRHTSESEHGVEAAVGPKQHVCLETVPDHQALGGVHSPKLTGDALEHEAAGLADHSGLAPRGHLQGCSEGPGSCQEVKIRARFELDKSYATPFSLNTHYYKDLFTLLHYYYLPVYISECSVFQRAILTSVQHGNQIIELAKLATAL